VLLASMATGGPLDMTISGKNTIRLQNILVGEVWVCSGQSNMQFNLAAAANAAEAIATAEDPGLRLFEVAPAPDLIAGFNAGYRISWEAAIGQATGRVIEDNRKAWSGDHCIDPPLVPGVLFCNRPIDCIDPGIEDMAPTALDLFGVDPPEWMDGKPLPCAV